MTTKFLNRAFALVLMAGFGAGFAWAQQPPLAPAPEQWVQVIVFRSLDPDAGDHERWSHRVPMALLEEGLDLPRNAQGGDTQAFRPASLGPKMKRVWAILRAAALYAPMLKIAWIQPALNLNEAVPVALNPIRKHTSSLTSGPSHQVTGEPFTPPRKPTVYGTVKITVLRHVYIAVHTVLVERKRTLNPRRTRSTRSKARSSSQGVVNVYPIDQANAVRPGRINYFDNPVYGVLVYVKGVPVTAPSTPPPG